MKIIRLEVQIIETEIKMKDRGIWLQVESQLAE